MATPLPALLALCTLFSSVSRAQFVNWQNDQINTSICTWEEPRAALIRDVVYLDGGNIWWSAGLNSGTYGDQVNDGNPGGLILTYNLSEAFTPSSNITNILLKDSISKAIGGKEQGRSSEPQYVDGGMLANDAEFFLYGGAMLRIENIDDPPAANDVLGYRRYAYGAEKPLLKQGFKSGSLPNEVTQYIVYGGAVNAPSENMAWYFSGLTSPDRGPFFLNGNESMTASNMSNTLIELDMSTQLEEKWSNITLPEKVLGRANAEVVWVPVGKKGILVVLGGVVYPEWATDIRQSANKTASDQQSPKFMQNIDIYDIAGKEWYQQPTTNGPGALTRGCAVVSPASDYSSYNIYYYGGFDGLHPRDEYSDQVWVLSLPSFTWTLLNKGTSSHARAGHKCFLPYPDQMMIFGGYTALKGSLITCLENGPIVLLNVSSGEWMDSYTPSKYSNYSVPDKVVAVIGGDRSGHATITLPKDSNWSSVSLKNIFQTKYDSTKVAQWWPYPEANPSNGTISPIPGPSNGNKGLLEIVVPSVVIPIFIVIASCAVIWWHCRKPRKSARPASTTTSEENGMRIVQWLRFNRYSKHLSPAESQNSDSTDAEKGYFDQKLSGAVEDTEVRYEMPDNQVVELFDTSSPAELYAGYAAPQHDRGRHETYVDSELVPCTLGTLRVTRNLPSGNQAAVSRCSGATINERAIVESTQLGQGGFFWSITCVPETLVQPYQHGEWRVSPETPVTASATSPERFETGLSYVDCMVSPLQITMSNETTASRKRGPDY